MTFQELIQVMEDMWPLDLQEEWDASGLQLGHPDRDIHRVMVALDCDLRTLEEALAKGCDTLVTHHPFLFNPLTLNTSTPVGVFIEKALKADMSIYSSHTPLDKVSMNVWLAEQLNLQDIHTCEPDGLVRLGTLKEPLSQDDFIALVKDAYHIPYVHIAGRKDAVQNVAVCGGSGADYTDALIPQADAYVTGDLKYHAGQKAWENGLLLCDIGHHAEVIMVGKVTDILREKTDLEVITSVSPDYYEVV